MAQKKDSSLVGIDVKSSIVTAVPAPQYVAGKTLGEKYSLAEYIKKGAEYLLAFKSNIPRNINPDFFEECYRRDESLYLSGELIL